MNRSRIDFQKCCSELEQQLTDYKNAYPRNVGAAVRKKFPEFMIVLSVLMFCNLADDNNQQTFAGILISPVLFIFGVYSLTKNQTMMPLANSVSLKNKISAALKTFAGYPDVRNYLEKISSDLVRVEARKKSVRKKFNIIFYGLIALIALKVFVPLGIACTKGINEELRNSGNYDSFLDALDLKKDEPFLRVQSLSRDAGGGVSVETQSLDIYLVTFKTVVDSNVNKRALEAVMPSLSGAAESDTFRLTITDTSGLPVPRCPKFVFASGECGVNVSSYVFCYDIEFSKQNIFQTLQTVLWLQKNENSLRFKVEKL